MAIEYRPYLRFGFTPRSIPRPKVGSCWFIMPTTSSSIEAAIVKQVLWEEGGLIEGIYWEHGEWFVTLESLSNPGSGGLYTADRFWEAVSKFDKLVKFMEN